MYINGTDETPEVRYDPKASVLSIKGSSFPENPHEFYQPLLTWLNDYLESGKAGELGLFLDLNYYNSSTLRVLVTLFQMLERYKKSGKNLAVNWCYDPDDEDSAEEARDLLTGFDTLAFELVPKR